MRQERPGRGGRRFLRGGSRVQDWVELFNGSDLTGWQARREPHTWRVVGDVGIDAEDPARLTARPGTGVLLNREDGRTVDLFTEFEHGSCALHLEYCVPARSNSGVYLQGRYEIQILDSWGEAPPLRYGTNGGIYARRDPQTKTTYDGHPPRSNASRPPGQWQELDVVFRAPAFDAEGRKLRDAVCERVVLNGEVIHQGVHLSGPTGGAWGAGEAVRGPLRLQGDHGPVAFRGIRVQPLD